MNGTTGSSARIAVLLLLCGMTVVPLRGQDTLRYERTEHLVPVRDGVRLFTVVYRPVNAGVPVPFLLQRTPYGAGRREDPRQWPLLTGLARDGYIFVSQDIRGRHKSEGTFEMLRRQRPAGRSDATDESTDAYDTIEWLLKNIAGNNGTAGALGVSYPGWTTMMATIGPHPALRAVSEQATMGDMFLGDDFHHNGALRLSYAFEYAYSLEATKGDTSFPMPDYDTYDFYLRLGPLSRVNEQYFHGTIPTWNAIAGHPSYDAYWREQALTSRIQTPTVPNLHVAGYWDQEDYYGPLNAYEVLERNDTQRWNNIVLGPWNHGGWQTGAGDRLGALKFDTATARTLTEVLLPNWFGYYLKKKGDGRFAEATAFQTGVNRWRTYDVWPPVTSAKSRNLYLREQGGLSFEAPKEKNGSDAFVSDPACPVPYRPRPVETTYGANSRWRTWLVEDQRFVHNRPDVLSWQTGPLADDLTVTGNVEAVLHAATTGSDADWVVKLIDVYPASVPGDLRMGGYQLMVASEIMRGRFHKSFEHPEALRPNEVNAFTFSLHAVNHVFRKGHRLMVQVQSSWFPLYDRNPQTFAADPMRVKESDFRKATHTIVRSVSAPSHLVLPVAPNAPTDDAAVVAASERAFAAMAKDSGTRSAFLAYLLPGSVVFLPQPSDARGYYERRPASNTLLSWSPSRVVLAASGEMALSTGPWEFRKRPTDSAALVRGHFVTIWKKQPDGSWKVKIDGGIPYRDSLVRNEGERFVTRTAERLRATRDEREEAVDAEAAYTAASAREGFSRAFHNAAADDVRVYRNGLFPAEGRASAEAMLLKESGRTRFSTIAGEVSQAGDLSYAYGIAVDANQDTSGYLHVWKNDGGWKLALDLMIPYKE